MALAGIESRDLRDLYHYYVGVFDVPFRFCRGGSKRGNSDGIEPGVLFHFLTLFTMEKVMLANGVLRKDLGIELCSSERTCS